MPKEPAKQKGNTVARVQALIEPVLSNMGLRLWDVRFEKEGPEWFLRIFIDADKPLDMETCERATRAIDPVIDEADPISASYYMEVGSPGLGRKLTKDEHFEILKGQTVKAHLIRALENGQKDVRGALKGKDGKMLCICEDDKDVEIDMSYVSYVKLCDDDDLPEID